MRTVYVIGKAPSQLTAGYELSFGGFKSYPRVLTVAEVTASNLCVVKCQLYIFLYFVFKLGH